MSILIPDVKCNQNECLGFVLTMKNFNKDIKMLNVALLKNLSNQFKTLRFVLLCFLSSLAITICYLSLPEEARTYK